MPPCLCLPATHPLPSPTLLLSTRHRFRLLKPPYASSNISLDSPSSNQTSISQPNTTGVIVIGGGLAGLAAATRLQADNIPFLLLEASDAVGGRVRSDVVDGFTLDRGFQIFITGYPEARKILNYDSLNLRKFYSGAQVYYGGRFHTVADPLRHLSDSLLSLTNPIGTVVDKLLIGLTRLKVLTQGDDEILNAEEVPTIDLLKKIGFSDSILERFFRPFFGGIFFDRELETTSRLFNFIFKCLALGDNTLPAKGIAAIPEQLAAKLPSNSILFNSRVVSVDSEFDSSSRARVKLQNGEMLESEFGVILAVEEPEAMKLLAGGKTTEPVRRTVCLYFSADQDKVPIQDPVLLLNGSGKGIINNMFFATNVAPSYAPAGKALVSVTLVGLYGDVADEDLVDRVVKELSGWFGESVVRSWSYLRMYRIRFAQPNQCPPTNLKKSPKVKPGLYICGDYVTSATFDGALVSGKKAAETLLQDRALVNKQSLDKVAQALCRFSGSLKGTLEAEQLMLKPFQLKQLQKATNNFSQDCLVGSGAFGNVYQGTFDGEGTLAIKKAHTESYTSTEDFENEIRLVSKVKHKNLVSLVGFCQGAGPKGEKVLVYEYVPNGSLLDYIMGRGGRSLTWRQRVNIAIGAAKGIAHLHEGIRPSIIHRDIKPSNILVGENFEAKVSDFGLVRSGPIGDQSHVSSQIKGTPGYLDPAYCSSLQLTPFTDVYSYGVILLQLVAARPVVEKTRGHPNCHIIDWARPSLERGSIDKIIDANLLMEECNMEIMLKMGQLGLKCVAEVPKERPTMTQVWQELEDAFFSAENIRHKQPSDGSLKLASLSSRSVERGSHRTKQLDYSQSSVSIDGIRLQKFYVDIDGLSFGSAKLRCLDTYSISFEDDSDDLTGTSEETSMSGNEELRLNI